MLNVERFLNMLRLRFDLCRLLGVFGELAREFPNAASALDRIHSYGAGPLILFTLVCGGMRQNPTCYEAG